MAGGDEGGTWEGWGGGSRGGCVKTRVCIAGSVGRTKSHTCRFWKAEYLL